MLSPETVERVRAVLEGRAAKLVSLKEECAAALGIPVCPACGSLVPSEVMDLAEHAKMFADPLHVALEVMS